MAKVAKMFFIFGRILQRLYRHKNLLFCSKCVFSCHFWHTFIRNYCYTGFSWLPERTTASNGWIVSKSWHCVLKKTFLLDHFKQSVLVYAWYTKPFEVPSSDGLYSVRLEAQSLRVGESVEVWGSLNAVFYFINNAHIYFYCEVN